MANLLNLLVGAASALNLLVGAASAPSLAVFNALSNNALLNAPRANDTAGLFSEIETRMQPFAETKLGLFAQDLPRLSEEEVALASALRAWKQREAEEQEREEEPDAKALVSTFEPVLISPTVYHKTQLLLAKLCA